MSLVAQDLREITARLGFHTIEEMVGRCDRLRQRRDVGDHKAATVNLKDLLYIPFTDVTVGHHFIKAQGNNLENTMDMSKLFENVSSCLN